MKINTVTIEKIFLNLSPKKQLMDKQKLFPFTIVFLYLIIAHLWIIFTDQILLLMINDIELLNKVQTYKGSIFIIITAIFLYHLCRDLAATKQSIKKTEIQMKEKENLLNKIISHNKGQAQFLVNLSHDLKTPLNLIFSSIQMIEIQWHNMNLHPNKYTNIMRQNCYRLIKLINNIIDITKYDSGFCDIKLKEYNIVKIVEDISLSVVEYIKSKGIKFIFDTDIEEKIIACDVDKIERAILNLLSNAVKFTKKGGTISVNIYDKVESILISVRDTGEGIPEEEQKRIFDRFMQIDNSYIKEYEGSGIGLSVVKSLIEMHGGTITCESEYGNGSEFIIEIPVTKVTDKGDVAQEINDKHINDFGEKINIEFSDIYFNN